MTEYNAIVTQSEPGWSIYVPEVDRHTYATHLRDVEPMARDLVHMMTDRPLAEITVAVQLPDGIAQSIEAMRRARDRVVVAEDAAREAQQAAATALRNVGAPLRDIAAVLDLSHQRVHQILEEADAMRPGRLAQLRREVDLSLAGGALAEFDLPVTDEQGNKPIVVAFGDERLSALIERIQAAGGYANVFAKVRAQVCFVAVIEESCAIGDPDETMVGDEAPSPSSTVEMLLDYVSRKKNGVTISAVLGHPACARDARPVELESV